MEINVNQEKLSSFFNLSPMGQTKRSEQYAKEDSFYKNKYDVVNKNFIFGIEVEAENVRAGNITAHDRAYWELTTDNSLRNNGVEFVSVPLKAEQVEKALTQLQNSYPKGVEFSPRTSTHIHMNVRDLNINQILNLVLIYTSVENILFNWVGHNRDKNIFCIKLTETDYIQDFINLNNDPYSTIRRWNKYTALNLHPIADKGTVEFRHLYGTWDIKTIVQWINFLSWIKNKAKTITTRELYNIISDLNTNSFYEEYLYSIFQEDTKILLENVQDLPKLLEDSIAYTKLCSITANPLKKEEVRLDWGATAELYGLRHNPAPENTPLENPIVNDATALIQEEPQVRFRTAAQQLRDAQIRAAHRQNAEATNRIQADFLRAAATAEYRIPTRGFTV